MSAENCIIDVHSITAAPLGWKFVDDNQPVACFALITVASVAHPGQFQGRMVIGLGTNDLCLDLLGKDVSMLTGDMHFVAQEI